MRRLAVALTGAVLGTTLGAGVAQARPEGQEVTARVVTVEMTDGLQYVPRRITVSAGDRVRWINTGTIAHTITTLRSKVAMPADARVPPGARAWDSGFVRGGRSYARRLTVPGTYRYFCIPHEGARMVGTIVVR